MTILRKNRKLMLDRERCIQCARCIRFQEEIVDDPEVRRVYLGDRFNG